MKIRISSVVILSFCLPLAHSTFVWLRATSLFQVIDDREVFLLFALPLWAGLLSILLAELYRLFVTGKLYARKIVLRYVSVGLFVPLLAMVLGPLSGEKLIYSILTNMIVGGIIGTAFGLLVMRLLKEQLQG